MIIPHKEIWPNRATCVSINCDRCFKIIPKKALGYILWQVTAQEPPRENLPWHELIGYYCPKCKIEIMKELVIDEL